MVIKSNPIEIQWKESCSHKSDGWNDCQTSSDL